MPSNRELFGPGSCIVVSIALLATLSTIQARGESAPRQVDSAGTTNVPHLALPPSVLLTIEEQSAVEQWKSHLNGQIDCFKNSGPVTSETVGALRNCVNTRFAIPIIEKMKTRYDVRIRSETITKVNTEIITPVEGVSRRHQNRVLINLHGGAFWLLGRYGGQIESIPIASTGRFKVISVDYRMAPEHKFPAASEDVVTVYRALLKDYRAHSIGIYGCSAGGVLTAEVVAQIQKERLPQPGAIGMFCGAASYWSDGDSGQVSATAAGVTHVSSSQDNLYFNSINPDDPLAFPVRSPAIMSKFPPSLLISSMRDLSLSSVVHTHSRLIKYGVEADLHVWEGLDHAFLYDSELPQSRDAYDVIVAFFDKHLGKH